MRLLLDENFPVGFAQHLTEHEIHTVHSLGWSGIKNGELLRRAHDVCDVFVTLDRNLQFQQNVRVLPFGIIIVHAASNRLVHLVPLATKIIDVASKVKHGEAVTVSQ